MPHKVIITRDFDHMSEVTAEFIRAHIVRTLAAVRRGVVTSYATYTPSSSRRASPSSVRCSSRK